jgi:rhodanese-related sulfurtransferase
MTIVNYDTVKKAIDTGVLLIDVRQPEEFVAGAIPTAKNIPGISLLFYHSSHWI